ncbi:MAG: ABC transporter permease [Dactylosporangium sp.]|nr:ABC transporter permease [Dactylosporangium sp.]NNJ60202.1 ABC transporter permease [Dactylosporangium sp.]
MTTLVLSRVAASAAARGQRSTAVAWRNVTAARHSAYWWVLVSGFVEPLLYLLSIGVGVGALVGGFTLADGTRVSYAAYVAPAMIAASAMNGAVAETTMNFFGKMKYMRLYDSVIATPVAPFEIALGELLWALLRGAMYSVAFLVIMTAAGLTTPLRALATLPATVLVGLAFGGIGMVLGTLMRSWQDFDYIAVGQVAMFLFSGTFAPAEGYSLVPRIILELTPLYHGVALIRGLTTWSFDWSILGHVGYLVGVAWLGLSIAARRTGRMLCP